MFSRLIDCKAIISYQALVGAWLCLKTSCSLKVTLLPSYINYCFKCCMLLFSMIVNNFELQTGWCREWIVNVLRRILCKLTKIRCFCRIVYTEHIATVIDLSCFEDSLNRYAATDVIARKHLAIDRATNFDGITWFYFKDLASLWTLLN